LGVLGFLETNLKPKMRFEGPNGTNENIKRRVLEENEKF
jgi:hypothetical protein